MRVDCGQSVHCAGLLPFLFPCDSVLGVVAVLGISWALPTGNSGVMNGCARADDAAVDPFAPDPPAAAAAGPAPAAIAPPEKNPPPAENDNLNGNPKADDPDRACASSREGTGARSAGACRATCGPASPRAL